MEPSVSVDILDGLLAGALYRQVDIRELLRKSAIEPNALERSGQRISITQLGNLCKALMHSLDDEALGLLERPVPLNSFRLACQAAMLCDNLEEVLCVFRDFYNLLDTGIVFGIKREDKDIVYHLNPTRSESYKSRYIIEHILVSHHRALCWFANARLPISQVTLAYSQPPYHDDYSSFFYGAPVTFNEPAISLRINVEHMRLKTVRNKPQLKRFIADLPLTILTQTVPPPDISTQLRSWLRRQLSTLGVFPDQHSCAAQFQIQAKTLRRRLAAEGTGFRELQAEIRKEQAVYFLTRTDLTVDQIAQKLAFAETASFIHAFKRWTNLTPQQYRKLISSL